MTQEALKMALPLLEDCVNSYRLKYERPAFDKAIVAIKEALAQPEQWGASAVTQPEYVAEQKRKTEELRSMLTQPEQEPMADDFFRMIADKNPKPFPLPQRTWVGLTNEEIHFCLNGLTTQSIEVYARSIEAKLKEKNT